jgi:hypothetical protein
VKADARSDQANRRTYRIAEEVERMRECMNRASRIVLDGFTLRVDHQIASWPDRYMDEDGEAHWNQLMKYLALCEEEEK